jgi:hypothetical protein
MYCMRWSVYRITGLRRGSDDIAAWVLESVDSSSAADCFQEVSMYSLLLHVTAVRVC